MDRHLSTEGSRIFIVEDEALIAMELQERLSNLGYVVCGIAARGEQAVRLVHETHPDLVLMDINLAGQMNGIEASARLHESSDVPVVFLTAFSDPELLRQATITMPFGYLVKPFDEQELHATIQVALYKHRFERALREANDRLEENVQERTADLRESEERFRQIAGSVSEVFWLADPGMSRILYVNPAYERVWGRSCASLYENPQSYLGSIHSEDRVRAMQDRGRRPLAHEYRVVRPDGSVRWVWERTFPVSNEATGEVVRYVGVVTDITARKHAEYQRERLLAELETAERRYRGIFESAADGILVADIHGRCLDANPAIEALLGYSRDELRTKSAGDLSAPGPAMTVSVFDELRRAGRWSGEYELRRKDGNVVSVEGRVTRVQEVDDTIFLGIFRDVTERKRAEDERARLQEQIEHDRVVLEAVMASIQDGLLIFDRGGSLTFVNGAISDLVGSDRAVVGAAAADLGATISDAFAAPRQFLADWLRAIPIVETRPSFGATTDPPRRHLSIQFFPIRDRSRAPSGFAVLMRDVTSIEHAARIEERERIAMDLHDGVVQLLYGLSLGLAAARRSPAMADPEARTILDTTHRDIRRVIDEARQLVHRLELRSATLEGRLAEVIAVAQATAPHDLRLESRIQVSEQPGREIVDHMLYIVREGVSNAIRHAQASLVELACEVGARRGRFVIRDNGIGFDPSARQTRTGRGVLNMRQRVRLIGGTITIRSCPGQGTEIQIDLPLKRQGG